METNADHSAFTMAGLTKREYFAAIAMQGYCSKSSDDFEGIAEDAVKQADALIAALNAPVTTDG